MCNLYLLNPQILLIYLRKIYPFNDGWPIYPLVILYSCSSYITTCWWLASNLFMHESHLNPRFFRISSEEEVICCCNPQLFFIQTWFKHVRPPNLSQNSTFSQDSQFFHQQISFFFPKHLHFFPQKNLRKRMPWCSSTCWMPATRATSRRTSSSTAAYVWMARRRPLTWQRSWRNPARCGEIAEMMGGGWII